MKEEKEKSYTIKEIRNIALALAEGIDSCHSMAEESAFLQQFPYTGKHDQDLSLAVATIFLVGMTHSAAIINKMDISIAELQEGFRKCLN